MEKYVEKPQNENTPFYPRSPYGVKVNYMHIGYVKITVVNYNMFICNGIYLIMKVIGEVLLS